MAYKVVRYFYKGGHRTIKSGLTLEEAQEHCRDPETSSRTCKTAARKRYTAVHGQWFDGYTECTR
jgi:hypothetical protein